MPYIVLGGALSSTYSLSLPNPSAGRATKERDMTKVGEKQ